MDRNFQKTVTESRLLEIGGLRNVYLHTQHYHVIRTMEKKLHQEERDGTFARGL